MDVMTEYAAELFGVAPEDVTEEQRNRAKKVRYADMYYAGEIKLGLIAGQYPIRKH